MSVDWQALAVCREEDPELFFPVGVSGPALLQVERAKAVCRACPVIEPCLSWAMTNGPVEGVWGGTSGDERRALLVAPARALAVTARSATPA